MKYNDTDYLVNREESIEYKEKIEENNAKYTKQELKQAIIDVDLLTKRYFKDNVTYKKALGIAKDCMEEVMQQQLNRKDKRIKELKELEEENKKYIVQLTDKQYRKLIDIIKKEVKQEFEQKVKDKIERHKIVKKGFEEEYDSKHYKDDDLRARDFYMIVAEDLIIKNLEELLEEK